MSNLNKNFDAWQEEQPSPFEAKFKEFLDDELAGEPIEELLLEIIWQQCEMRRQLNDFIAGNNPGMYD